MGLPVRRRDTNYHTVGFGFLIIIIIPYYHRKKRSVTFFLKELIQRNSEDKCYSESGEFYIAQNLKLTKPFQKGKFRGFRITLISLSLLEELNVLAVLCIYNNNNNNNNKNISIKSNESFRIRLCQHSILRVLTIILHFVTNNLHLLLRAKIMKVNM
jgi:hypothetical protein